MPDEEYSVSSPGHVTTTRTCCDTHLQCDPSYICTQQGVLKATQVGSSLLGFFCVLCSKHKSAGKGRYYMWISMIAFWFTAILLLFYVFHIIEKFFKIPWTKLELFFACLWAPLFLIAAILATTVGDGANYAASFFGFCATAAFTLDAYLKWHAKREGGLAQGTQVVSRVTTSHVTPRVGY